MYVNNKDVLHAIVIVKVQQQPRETPGRLASLTYNAIMTKYFTYLEEFILYWKLSWARHYIILTVERFYWNPYLRKQSHTEDATQWLV